jgi:hypothetical protein
MNEQQDNRRSDVDAALALAASPRSQYYNTPADDGIRVLADEVLRLHVERDELRARIARHAEDLRWLYRNNPPGFREWRAATDGAPSPVEGGQ